MTPCVQTQGPARRRGPALSFSHKALRGLQQSPPPHCTPLALLLARPLAGSLQLIGFDIKKNCHEEHFQKMRAKQMGWGGRVLFCNRKRRGVTSSLLCFSLAFLFIPLSPSLAFRNLRFFFFYLLMRPAACRRSVCASASSAKSPQPPPPQQHPRKTSCHGGPPLDSNS